MSVNEKLALECNVQFAGDASTLSYSWATLTGNFDLANGDLLLSGATSPRLIIARDALEQGAAGHFVNYSFWGDDAFL